MNSEMTPSARPVLEAHQRIGGAARRASSARTELRERHDHRVDVGPQRVVPQVDEDVVPGVERRLEVDERHVERAAVTWIGSLNEVTTSQ